MKGTMLKWVRTRFEQEVDEILEIAAHGDSDIRQWNVWDVENGVVTLSSEDAILTLNLRQGKVGVSSGPGSVTLLIGAELHETARAELEERFFPLDILKPMDPVERKAADSLGAMME